MTPHFKFDEVVATKTGLANMPSPRLAASIGVCTALYIEPVRKLFNRPMIISSWYRSPAVNKAVGGSPTSDHMEGVAIDYKVQGLDNYTAACMLRDSDLPFDQIILEYGWIHTGFGVAMRRQCLTKRSAASPYQQGLLK